MEIPIESWFKAINVRHSRRAFTGHPLPEGKLHHLQTICNEFRPFKGARAVFVRNPPENVFTGVIGSYGNIKDAPHIIAFVGDTTVSEMHEVTGYLGEGIVLEATSKDIQTCWVGGFFRPEIVTKIVELQSTEKVIAVTPIGYSLEKKSMTEKTFSRFVQSHNRKPIEDLLIKAPVSYPYWMISALEAARLAPSAANRQPWRFIIDENSIKVCTDNLRGGRWVSKRFDCGIAMLHIELGARVNGVDGKWEFLSGLDVARYSVSKTSNQR